MIDSQPIGRRPTPREILYAWHTEALTGARVPMSEGDPKPGWYLRLFGRKNEVPPPPAPMPVVIYVEQPVDDAGFLTGPENLVCVIGGRKVDPVEVWTRVAKNPISQADYMKLCAAKMGDF